MKKIDLFFRPIPEASHFSISKSLNALIMSPGNINVINSKGRIDVLL